MNGQEMPLLSVVIPVYNVERFLQPCIDSLMNQTLTRVEYIFINDASTDNCLQILNDNAVKHSDKMKVINSPENRCQGGARNLGIKAARGKYIGFVDSDDVVLPDMFEKLYNPIQNGFDYDAVICQYAAVPEEYMMAESMDGGGWKFLH